MNGFVPNSFQTPNVYVDAVLPYLTEAEMRVLLFATRHILGWRESVVERAAHISLTRFEQGFVTDSGIHFAGCGVRRPAIVRALEQLEVFGLLKRVGKAHPGKGQKWSLGEPTDEQMDQLRARMVLQANQRRFAKETRGGSPKKPEVVSQANQGWFAKETAGGSLGEPKQTHYANTSANTERESFSDPTPTVGVDDAAQSVDTPPTLTTVEGQLPPSPSSAAPLPPEPLPARPTVYAQYEQYIGQPINDRVAQHLIGFVNEYGADMVEQLLKLAATTRPRSFIPWASTVLNDWARQGGPPRTATDAEAALITAWLNASGVVDANALTRHADTAAALVAKGVTPATVTALVNEKRKQARFRHRAVSWEVVCTDADTFQRQHQPTPTPTAPTGVLAKDGRYYPNVFQANDANRRWDMAQKEATRDHTV